jgi:hypothetical protein
MMYVRIFLSIAFAGALAAQPALAQMGMGKPPIPMTLSQYDNVSTGGAIQIVVRVESRTRATLHAQFLERVGDLVYRPSGRNVDLYMPDDVPVIMGTADDVKPGAVLYVYGVATKPNNADVKRLVVDTLYVQVRGR